MARYERETRPEYIKRYYTRPETEKARQLNRAIKKIGTTDIRKLSRDELKQVAIPIIREAKARIRQLEEYGLTDSPAYQYIKSLDINVSAAGKDINVIRQNVMEAYNFLHTKTSTVEGAADYNRWLDEHLGFDTTREQREKIWDIVHRFEKTHPQQFINYGYDEAIKRISKYAATMDFDADEAYNMLVTILEREKGLDVEGYEPEDSSFSTPWFRGEKGRFGDF